MWILINNSRLHRRGNLIPCLPLRRGYRRKATLVSWPMLSLVFLTAVVAPALPQHTDTMVEPRQRMVRDIEAEVRKPAPALAQPRR